MTDDRSLERAARSWLEEGPTRAPDRPVEAALLAIEAISQERDLRIPWRFPTMNPAIRIAAAAIVIAAVALGGVYLALRNTAQVGPPTPTIEGTWETQFTRDQMLGAGIGDSAEDNSANYGHFVWSLQGGIWFRLQLDGPAINSQGTYQLDAGELSMTEPPRTLGGRTPERTWAAPYTASATTLTLGNGSPVTYRVAPWTRVSAVVSTSPSALTLEAYRSAWKTICQAATNAPALPHEELWGVDRLFDSAMSASDRALSLEVGRQLAIRFHGWADKLQSLNPPADLAANHLAYVTRLRGIAAIVRDEVDALAAGNLTGARALDESTGPLSGAQVQYQANWGLEPCP